MRKTERLSHLYTMRVYFCLRKRFFFKKKKEVKYLKTVHAVVAELPGKPG